MDFKILFTSPYEKIDILNDNIDINVVLPNNEVYFATLFTILNIQLLLDKSEDGYFRANDMIIVKELTTFTIRYVVENMIRNDNLTSSMSLIGFIKDVLPNISKFDEVKNFGCPYYGIS